MQPRSVMSKSFATVVTLTAALLAVAIPVVVAIRLADQQARATQMALVATYAKDALHRSETTSKQAFDATQALGASPSEDPCSDANLAIMRRFDLASSYLHALGHIVDGEIGCSSLGRDAGALPLGPVDWITPAGNKIRISVVFPFDPATKYLVIETRNGFAAIVNKDMPLDVATSEQDVTLAVFATDNGRLYAARGFVDPHWVGALSNTLPAHQLVTTFVDRGYVVAVVRSNRFYLGTIAALPVSYMLAQTRMPRRKYCCLWRYWPESSWR